MRMLRWNGAASRAAAPSTTSWSPSPVNGGGSVRRSPSFDLPPCNGGRAPEGGRGAAPGEAPWSDALNGKFDIGHAAAAPSTASRSPSPVNGGGWMRRSPRSNLPPCNGGRAGEARRGAAPGEAPAARRFSNPSPFA